MNSGILTAVHNDRNDGYGVVIVINKKHLMIEDNHFKFTGGNIVSIKIETLKKTVIFCACYRSPNNGNTSNDSLISNLLAIRKKYKNNPIWRGGHFNLPDVSWLSNNIIGLSWYFRAS